MILRKWDYQARVRHLTAKQGWESVKLYVRKKLSFDFNSEIAIKAMENWETWKSKKSDNARPWNAWFFSGLFAMQSICYKCLLRICFRNTEIYFDSVLLLSIQSFSNKFLLDIQWLNKYLKCLYALEKSQNSFSLEKEVYFLHGSLLFFGVYLFSLVFLIILNHLRHSWNIELSQDIDYHLIISDLCQA